MARRAGKHGARVTIVADARDGAGHSATTTRAAKLKLAG
jgi:hypothetical protein